LWLARATLLLRRGQGMSITQSVYVNGELVEGLSNAEHRNNKFLILPLPYIKLHILNADMRTRKQNDRLMALASFLTGLMRVSFALISVSFAL
jgi:hypothetical protein